MSIAKRVEKYLLFKEQKLKKKKKKKNVCAVQRIEIKETKILRFLCENEVSKGHTSK